MRWTHCARDFWRWGVAEFAGNDDEEDLAAVVADGLDGRHIAAGGSAPHLALRGTGWSSVGDGGWRLANRENSKGTTRSRSLGPTSPGAETNVAWRRAGPPADAAHRERPVGSPHGPAARAHG
jgi:hypothetical protein